MPSRHKANHLKLRMKPSLKIKAADGKADKDVRSGQGTKRDRFNPATAFHTELARSTRGG